MKDLPLLSILFLLLLLCPLVLSAQKITFLNSQGEGIFGVYVSSNQGHNYLSNALGVVNLQDESPYYTLSHINYETKKIARKDLPSKIILEEKVNALEEVVIGANKWEENKKEVPQQIVEFEKKDIELQQPMTTADIISSSGEVFVQKSQMGGGSPMIRGFAANQVLLVIDGVRMNNAIYRNGNLQNIITIDPHTIKDAEVLFGPASVMYGSDALGGVMDFHTIAPQYAEDSNALIFGEAKLGINSAASEKTAHVQLNVAKNKWAYWGSFSVSSFDDLKSGQFAPNTSYEFGWKPFKIDRVNNTDIILENPDVHIQSPSGYHQVNTLQKIAYRPKKHLELMYTFSFSNSSNIPMYDRLTELNSIQDQNGNEVNVTMQDILSIQNNELLTSSGSTTPKFAEWYYGPQYWMMNNVRMKWNKVGKFADGLSIITGHQKIKENRYQRKFGNINKQEDKVNLDLLHLNIDANKKMKNDWSVFYGGEGTMNFVASKAQSTNIENGTTEADVPRYAGGGSEMHTLAAYITTKKQWSEHLTMTAGVRYSHTFLHANYTDSVSKSLNLPYSSLSQNVGSITGSMGLAYHTDKWQLRTQFAKGFKAPNIDDVAKVYNPSKDDLVLPNPDLKPTDVYSVDLSIERYFNRITLSAVGFYSRLKNAMVRQEGTFNGQDSIIINQEKYAVLSLQNTGKAEIAGVSGKLNWDINQQLFVRSTITYTYGRDLINSTSMRHVPPLFGKAEIGYQKNKLMLNLSSAFSGSIELADLAPSEQNKSYLYAKEGSLSWWTLDFNSSYRINNYLQVFGGIDNILNLNYRTYSSGINAAGRNYKLQLKAYF
ncbi:TonB-dependent receptor [Flammeovirga pacifica]|uniref:TonB-dependent receptor n=1 Tax=Flammeovirga pacifica TaxID=915059 RepID=A0A1S1YSC2_FLAPC|nr:TonB-dependent receptor [Flammeovirga pacifica]OHX63927.1 hypothetical protein NH26_20160 [Flammeovirga pacifica]